MSILTEKYGFKELEPSALVEKDFNPFKKIDKEWFLVTAGDENGWNTMTASWGFAGIMWGRQTFTTVIRPQRHTKVFIDKADTFTICFFDESERKALAFCGSHSGRDCNKAEETGLVPVFTDGTTAFEQAKLVLVCEKAYVQQMNAESFINKDICEANYASGDFHYQYIGVIKKVYVK
ncbi:flavin reductase [uncultured Ruminococcus sp.]|uniref:flavin reductase n=1 Tax=uncultured Ruminococcus sp. TaxID=165186 RepID=UPI0025F8BFF5|nr:flavin reductase [uncultured Ruminococcus sp.]